MSPAVKVVFDSPHRKSVPKISNLKEKTQIRRDNNLELNLLRQTTSYLLSRGKLAGLEHADKAKVLTQILKKVHIERQKKRSDSKELKIFGEHNLSQTSSIIAKAIDAQKKGYFNSYLLSDGSSNDTKQLPISYIGYPNFTVHPLEYLRLILGSRQYCVTTHSALKTYRRKPSQLQIASYGKNTIGTIRTSDHNLLDKMISFGISPNPCNRFGESLLHMACRKSEVDIVRTMHKHGCDTRITDDFGRMPLHDACWTTEPSFQCVQIILEGDGNLFLAEDARGSTPLIYAPMPTWGKWAEFLDSVKDIYWPTDNNKQLLKEKWIREVDPAVKVDIEIAKRIADGSLDLEEFLRKVEIKMER